MCVWSQGPGRSQVNEDEEVGCDSELREAGGRGTGR